MNGSADIGWPFPFDFSFPACWKGHSCEHHSFIASSFLKFFSPLRSSFSVCPSLGFVYCASGRECVYIEAGRLASRQIEAGGRWRVRRLAPVVKDIHVTSGSIWRTAEVSRFTDKRKEIKRERGRARGTARAVEKKEDIRAEGRNLGDSTYIAVKILGVGSR